MNDLKEQIDALAMMPVDEQTSEKDFLRTIRAINLSCRIADREGRDRTAMRDHLDKLYPQFEVSFAQKKDAQDASDLVHGLYAFIYKRSFSVVDRGPYEWQRELQTRTYLLVSEYRKEPKLDAYDFVDHLRVHCSLDRFRGTELAGKELIKNIIDGLLKSAESMPDAPAEEQIKWALPRLTVQGNPYVMEGPDKRWTAFFERVAKRVKLEELSDKGLLLWRRFAASYSEWYMYKGKAIDTAPAYEEMKKRKGFELELLEWEVFLANRKKKR